MANLIKKWWFKLFVVGVLIRLVLMPITFHPDLWAFSSAAHFFAYEGRLNIYEHLAKLPSEHPLVQSTSIEDLFIYPPLFYFTTGFFRLLVKPFANPNFMPMIWQDISSALSYPTFHSHIFLFKLPYLFFDIAAAFLFASLFTERMKKYAFALWIFNPLTLYATFMVGQFDILPTFFTILALYFAKKKNYLWSVVSLGLGGSYKMYPLLLVLPAAFIFGKGLKEKLKYIFFGFLPYFLTILPFINSAAFRQMALFSPKSQKMLFMGLHVSGAEVVYPFILILSFIYLHAYYSKRKLKLEHYFLGILLLIFSVTHYHPQWFLWLTPFLFWVLIKYDFKYSLLVISLFATWLIITLFFEPSLTYGLFNPLFPNLKDVSGLAELTTKYIDAFQVKSMVRSYFAGTSLFLVYSVFKERRKTTSQSGYL